MGPWSCTHTRARTCVCAQATAGFCEERGLERMYRWIVAGLAAQPKPDPAAGAPEQPGGGDEDGATPELALRAEMRHAAALVEEHHVQHKRPLERMGSKSRPHASYVAAPPIAPRPVSGLP